MPGDLKVFLGHVVPDALAHRVYLRAQRGDDLPPHSGQRVSLETTIHDGRGRDLKLDEAAFELIHHPTALDTDAFYDRPEEISTRYYAEMKALLTTVTGSPHVVVFHHQVRNQRRVSSDRVMKDGSITTSTPVQPYAVDGIHTDSSCFHAESLFEMMAPEGCRRGRFLYINAWRNISDEPIEDNHLAVLDERSLVKPDDYIQQHLHGVGYDVLQYTLSARNVASHRWYYFPDMTRDEVLVFKQWDSDPQLSGRQCFHTAFKDPTARADAPVRQSIETRAFVFFPDHEPNTCPPMPMALSTTDSVDEARARKGSAALLGAVAYIKGNDSTRAMIVGSMKALHSSGGARAVLMEFAEDKQGHFGMTDANAETKARCVELCLEKGVGKDVDELLNGPCATRLALGMVLRSHVTTAVLGAASALVVKALLGRRAGL